MSPPDGEHRFAVRAVDDLGNRGAVAEHVCDLDRTAPVITLVSGPAALLGHERTHVPARVDRAGDAHLPPGRGRAARCVRVVHDLADGAHTLSWEMFDLAGNAGVVPAPYSWTIDTHVPG